ncbi:MAG: hypothetical protein IT488_10415 [Gammaproteobacteria bacterium]|nr:hypothetical protein [Gammaproteobacteria bacterium]
MSLTRLPCSVLVMFLSLSLAFPGVSSGRAIGLPPADASPPQIIHIPLTEFPADMPLRVQATVTDNVGVAEVMLMYRGMGDSEYRRMPMLEAHGSDIYSADLPDTAGPRIEYFIQAHDRDGNATPDLGLEPNLITVTSMATDVAAAPDDAIAPLPAREREGGVSTWVWIGLGVVAMAALASGGSSGGDAVNSGTSGNSDNSGTGTVTITAPVP